MEPMRRLWIWVIVLLAFFPADVVSLAEALRRPILLAQQEQTPPEAKAAETDRQEKLSVTRHSLRLSGGRQLDYTATAGWLKLKEDSGKPRADIFFVAYVLEGQDPASRPVTFAFNGGPGASSVWLHLGAIGPKRVATGDAKTQPPPPGDPTPNENTWLPFTDLVFIDPVGTGFSRTAPGVDAKQFYGTREDVRSVGEAIRLYTSRFGRWLSPKLLAGESYGALRAAELSQHLYDAYAMDVVGMVLLSPALVFESFVFNSGSDLPYLLFLPSFSASAQYHQKLPIDLQGKGLNEVLAEAEDFASNRYSQALLKGRSITDAEKQEIAADLSRFTGLPEPVIKNRNLRVSWRDFSRELLRDKGLTLGMLDGRTTRYGSGGGFTSDPGMAATVGPYTSAFNHYAKEELMVDTPLPYIYLSDDANNHWDWGASPFRSANGLDALEKAMNRSRRLKVLLAAGYFDLDVPYFAAKYAMNHLELDPELAGNISAKFYPGGHMFYTSPDALESFTRDTAQFFKSLTAPGR